MGDAKKNRRELIVYLCTVVLSVVFLLVGNRSAGYRPRVYSSGELTCTAVVREILDIQTQTYTLSGEAGEVYTETIAFRARLTNGELKGTTVTGYQQLDSMLAAMPDRVSAGDRIVLSFTDMGDGQQAWYFMEYHRSGALIGLVAFFFVMLLLFGRIKGVNTIVSLVFTCLAVFAVFIPAILAGRNVYLWSAIICVFVTTMTLLIVSGASRKSLCAGAGCLGGLAFTGLLTLLMDRILHLTGMVDEQSIYLTMLEGAALDLRAIIFGAILVGAMGATMDVSMSLASSLQEVAEHSQGRIGFGELVKSGFHIGRDMMCTMANTLILAYIGSSLSTVLLLASSAESLLSLFNREMIVVEVLQAVVGSLGILFTIPATSLLAASVYQGKKPSRKQEMRMARKAAISGELNGKYDSLLKQNHPPKPEDTQK